MFIPAESSAITPDALNRLFQSTGARLPVVAGVEVAALGGGYGYLSKLFRLEIRWTGDGKDDAPRMLVAKLPVRARIENMTADAVRMFRREAMFHQLIAPVAPLRTAKAWVAEFDEESGASTMIFEDLSDLHSFGDFDSISVPRIRESLVQLARLHARHWDNQHLSELDWLAHPSASGVDQVSSRRFDELWPRMVESGAYQLSPVQLRLGELLRTKLDGVYEALHAGPKSLIHADLHQENLFFDRQGPVFIDWALAEHANPAKDVAKLTASCLAVGTVGREQPGLIATYFQELQSQGVSDYSLGEIERYVHLATCHYLAMMSFLSDRDFSGLAANKETRTDFTSSRVIAACDREEIVAVVEGI